MESITQEQLENFSENLFSRELSRNTVASYIRNAKIFLNWYEEKNNVHYNSSEIDVPKTPKKLVYIYSSSDIARIFNAIDTCSDWLTARNKAMVALMLDSGIRQGEVCSLKTYNLFFDESQIKVCGKGNKERMVPFGNTAQVLVREYLSMRPFESENVFLSIKGKPLSCGAIKSMTYDLQNKLPFPFSSHKLRHNFATNYLLNQYEEFGQMDIYQLMIIMGHEDVSTVRKYLHHASSILASRSCLSHLDRLYLKTS